MRPRLPEGVSEDQERAAQRDKTVRLSLAGLAPADYSLEFTAEMLDAMWSRAFPDPQPWTCPTCGETIEGQFAECWNCAADGVEL